MLSSPAQKQRKVLKRLVSSNGTVLLQALWFWKACVYTNKGYSVILCMYIFVGTQYVGIEDFVENAKRYSQGFSPSPAFEAAVDDDDDDGDDDDEPVKNPDELPLHQKVLKYNRKKKTMSS